MALTNKWLRLGAVFLVATAAFTWGVGSALADHCGGPSLPSCDEEDADSEAAPGLPVPETTAPSAEAPLPPQAPLDGVDAGAVDQLPSAGSGGYLDAGNELGQVLLLLMGVFATVLGSGAIVWSHSRNR